MSHKNSLLVPSIDYLLTLPFWEMHEAVYVLTDCWPEKLILYPAFSVHASKQYRLGHNVLCIPKERLNFKVMGCRFGEVFFEMKKSIKRGELTAISEILQINNCYGEKSLYLIPSREAILWSLLKGFILPENLSKSLNIHQIKNFRPHKNSHDTLKNKIIIQYIKIQHPKASKAFLRDHLWMKHYGTNKQPKTIRRAIDELLGLKSGPGRVPKGATREYFPKPIPEIMRKNPDDVSCFYFPLFKTAMTMAAKIIIEIIGFNKLLEMTENEFINEFLKDTIVQLYLKDASFLEIELALQFCYETLIEHYPHPKVNAIPYEERKDKKIKELYDLNKEFIFEVFTEEERQKMNLF